MVDKEIKTEFLEMLKKELSEVESELKLFEETNRLEI